MFWPYQQNVDALELLFLILGIAPLNLIAFEISEIF